MVPLLFQLKFKCINDQLHEKKSSVKTDLYLRFLGKRLKEAVSFHSILSLRFSVESGALSGGGCG